MKHVAFNRNQKPGVGSKDRIHILNGTQETWCHQPMYDPNFKFDGKLLARGFDTKAPATCKKCRGVLITELTRQLRNLTLPELEKVAETLGYVS